MTTAPARSSHRASRLLASRSKAAPPGTPEKLRLTHFPPWLPRTTTETPSICSMRRTC